jgi:GNAT superfamily N-acetyltransferase
VDGPLIRPAGADDVPQIARLHLASYRAAYGDVLPAAFLAGLTLADRERRWQASVRDPARHTLITTINNANVSGLIAFAEIGAGRDDDAGPAVGELIAMHVAEEYWHRGIGRMLHGHVAAALAGRGFAAGTLWVLTGNRRARVFYAALGWAPDGHARDQEVSGIRIPEVRYRIRLG